MKFIDKYPTMKPIFEVHNDIMRGRGVAKCCICHQPTEFIEINYEAHICSDECLNKMDDLYFEALKKGGEEIEEDGDLAQFGYTLWTR